MKLRIALTASMIVGCALAYTAHAAPPEGKGPGNSAGHPAKGNGTANPGKGNPGNSGKGNPGRDNAAPGNSGQAFHRNDDDRGRYDDRRRYDDRGRNYDYFDSRRDRQGHLRGDRLLSDLVYAGITAALAREHAHDFGLRGYSSLPPGIRKNLARGKPLPPGIAKKMVPGSLLARLPRHPGYEWRVAGTDLILISVATAVIADILYDVFD